MNSQTRPITSVHQTRRVWELQRRATRFPPACAANGNLELQKRTTPAPCLCSSSPPDLERRFGANVNVIERLQSTHYATNTTLIRDNLPTARARVEAYVSGGLSGKPLTKQSTQRIAELFRLTRGRSRCRLGGIFTPKTAWERSAPGLASCIVHRLIYKGPRLAPSTKLVESCAGRFRYIEKPSAQANTVFRNRTELLHYAACLTSRAPTFAP